jgi:hypothetical protein
MRDRRGNLITDSDGIADFTVRRLSRVRLSPHREYPSLRSRAGRARGPAGEGEVRIRLRTCVADTPSVGLTSSSAPARWIRRRSKCSTRSGSCRGSTQRRRRTCRCCGGRRRVSRPLRCGGAGAVVGEGQEDRQLDDQRAGRNRCREAPVVGASGHSHWPPPGRCGHR